MQPVAFAALLLILVAATQCFRLASGSSLALAGTSHLRGTEQAVAAAQPEQLEEADNIDLGSITPEATPAATTTSANKPIFSPRQLNSIEPFLEERARQLANGRQDGTSATSRDSYDPLASVSSSGLAGSRSRSLSGGGGGGELDAVGRGISSGRQYSLPPAYGSGYGGANAYGAIQQQQQQQALYNTPSIATWPGQYQLAGQPTQTQHATNGGAYRNEYSAAKQSGAASYGSGHSSGHSYSSSGGGGGGGANYESATNIIDQSSQDYPQPQAPSGISGKLAAAPTTATGEQQYRGRLPQMHEVVELADPIVKSFATKSAKQKSGNKTVISFKLARKILAAIDAVNVMQPEFYIQEDQVEHTVGSTTTLAPSVSTSPAPSESGANSTTTSTTTTTPTPREKLEQPAKTNEKDQPQQQQAGEQRDDRAREPEPATEVDADTAAQEGDGASEHSDYEGDTNLAHQEAGERPEGSFKLKPGQLASLDKAAAKRNPENEFKDKMLNDFGRDKIDKLQNFLQFAEKHGVKLGKKIGLEHRTPDEAEAEERDAAQSANGSRGGGVGSGNAPAKKNGNLSKQHIVGNEKQFLGPLTPPIEIPKGELTSELSQGSGAGKSSSSEESGNGADDNHNDNHDNDNDDESRPEDEEEQND